MESMVEKVAKAICKAHFLNGGAEDDDGWDDATPELKDQYRAEARAAIEAMREPTVEMLRAGFEDYPTVWTAGITPEDRVGLYRAMIDAVFDPATLSAEDVESAHSLPKGRDPFKTS